MSINEHQKPVTDKYRDNYDRIFGRTYLHPNFGVVHIKGEGMPIHPDDVDYNWCDEYSYKRQLDAYNKVYNLCTQ